MWIDSIKANESDEGFEDMQIGVWAIGERPWSHKMSLGRGNEVHYENPT